MDNIIGIIAFVFVLGMIIAVHEGGHFLFAKRVNILVREFAFGMGPQLFKKKKGETEYSIRAFPIGGFCAIAGEETEDDPFKAATHVKLHIENGMIRGFYLDVDDESIAYPVYKIISYDLYDAENSGNLYMIAMKDNEPENLMVDPQAFIYHKKKGYQIAPYNRTIGSKPKRQRAMVIFGGPLMNFLLALLVFFLAALMIGFPNMESSKISGVLGPEEDYLGSPAYLAGLQDGDTLQQLKSGTLVVTIDEWADVSLFMSQYTELGLSAPIEVNYLRQASAKQTTINPQVFFYNIGVQGEFALEGIQIKDLVTIDDTMASNAQLAVDDIITKINNVGYANLDQMYLQLQNFIGNSEVASENEVRIEIIRDGQTSEVVVRPYSQKIMNTQKTSDGERIPSVKVAMGVSPTYHFDFVQSLVYSGKSTASSFTAIIDTFDLLFNDDTVTIAALSGPVGIFSVTKQIASNGFPALLNWMGLLSVNVGLLNLLPIPALDGGRLLFIGYEAITRKKTNPKVETMLITITMLLLFGLMIYVTFNDILDLIK
jgi:regulator of sigma E protease